MIISLFYLIASTFLQGIAFILVSLNYNPNIASLFSGVSYFLSFTGYFYGVLDLPALFAAAGVAITFEIFWFSFLCVWWIAGFFRAMISIGGTSGH